MEWLQKANFGMVFTMKTLVIDFFTAFQFLTRFECITIREWSEEAFGRCVKFFPVVGAIIGCILAAVAYMAQYAAAGREPVHLLAACLIMLEICMTGGLHCDGLMDTTDGIFSGRSRERMLEIMKDSRVGAFGVIGFCLLLLVKYSLLLDMTKTQWLPALITMPVLARMASVIAITLFPYARPDGLGKTFSQHSNGTTLVIAVFFTAILLLPVGYTALWAALVVAAAAVLFARYVSKRLGGLTGDVYGAVIEISEVLVLLVFCLA